MKKLDEKRCRWYCHVKGIGNERLSKLFVNSLSDGRNRRGRPEKKRRDNLREGLERNGLPLADIKIAMMTEKPHSKTIHTRVCLLS